MFEKDASSSVQVGESATRDMIRAAGSATLMAGVLTATYALAFTVVMPSLQDKSESLLGVAVGVGLLYSGLRTLRAETRGLWITLIIMGLVLATQLWAGYAWGRTPARAGLSLYLLTVPLVVILVNTRAITAARRLQPRTA